MLLLAGPGPQQPGPPDTTRVIRGFFNQSFAWGTLVLRNGERLQGYLPASTSGVALTVPYYVLAPDSSPAPRPKFIPISKVGWMRVRGQYSERFAGEKKGQGDEVFDRMAARRQSGAVELFMLKAAPLPLLSALGSGPVLSSPVGDNSAERIGAAPVQWYLRRPNGAVLAVKPDQFASQVSAFLADDAELAKRVAAGQEGYRIADTEDLIKQYNQRAKR